METLDYRFDGRTAVQFPRDAVLVGVLASGNRKSCWNRWRSRAR